MKKINEDNLSDRCSVSVYFYDIDEIVSYDWVKHIYQTVLDTEHYYPQGELSVIFVSDDYISQLNRKFLNRNSPTDVLAFPMNDDNLWGEIYISVERAKEQCEQYQVCLNNELARLVIHGILHLMGYTDEQADAKKRMQHKENFYIKKIDV